MRGLGWSAPAQQPVTPCSRFDQVATRPVCAVSPQDDWIRSSCGCFRQLNALDRPVSCRTESGNTGELHCCPSGCPSTAADGGVSTVQQGGGGGGGGSKLPGEQEQRSGSTSSSTSTLLPWVIGGAVVTVAIIGVGYYLVSREEDQYGR